MALHYDEKGKFFTDYVTKESIRAIIQTSKNRITGQLHVRMGERVSDELNRSDRFLAVTEVVIYDLDGTELRKCDFMLVNIDRIVWLVPEENERPDPEIIEDGGGVP